MSSSWIPKLSPSTNNYSSGYVDTKAVSEQKKVLTQRLNEGLTEISDGVSELLKQHGNSASPIVLAATELHEIITQLKSIIEQPPTKMTAVVNSENRSTSGSSNYYTAQFGAIVSSILNSIKNLQKAVSDGAKLITAMTKPYGNIMTFLNADLLLMNGFDSLMARYKSSFAGFPNSDHKNTKPINELSPKKLVEMAINGAAIPYDSDPGGLLGEWVKKHHGSTGSPSYTPFAKQTIDKNTYDALTAMGFPEQTSTPPGNGIQQNADGTYQITIYNSNTIGNPSGRLSEYMTRPLPDGLGVKPDNTDLSTFTQVSGLWDQFYNSSAEGIGSIVSTQVQATTSDLQAFLQQKQKENLTDPNGVTNNFGAWYSGAFINQITDLMNLLG